MTLLEFYEQFCKQYREENNEALIALVQEQAKLLSTDIVVFKTQEAYESVAIAERPLFSYIVTTKLWITTTADLTTAIEDKENLFLKALVFKAILSRDIAFLNKFRLNVYFSAKDEQLICDLLTLQEINSLFVMAIQSGTIYVTHAVLKQLLLKTQGVFDLSESLVDDLTALDLLAHNSNGPTTRFNKKMMFFYAAAWDYFVGEAPTVENIHQLPSFFSLAQPHANIENFLNLQAANLSMHAVNAKENPFFSSVGLCVGLSYLYGYYAARGRADYCLMTIALLKLWQGNEAQLDKPLPAVLPQALFYKTLRELFQQWTNDILVFHSPNIDALILRPQTGIETQLPMTHFDLVKPKSEETTQLILIEDRHWHFDSYGTLEQFSEYLTYLIQIPHVHISFGQNDHETSISTLVGNGQTIHFDPGDIRDVSQKRKPGESKKSSVQVLIESLTQAHPEWESYSKSRGVLVYRYNGPQHKNPWAESCIFSDEDLPKTVIAAKRFQENSSNRFTQLHVAVLVQDTETIRKILEAGKVDISAKDGGARYAIDIAVENGYWEGTKLLLADPRTQSFVLILPILNKLLRQGDEDFIVELIQHEKVRCDLIGLLELSILHNSTKIMKLLLADPRIDHFLLSNEIRNALVQFKREDFIIQLIQHEKVICSLVNLLERSMSCNGTKIIHEMKAAFLQEPQKFQTLLITSVKILFCTKKEELAKELFIFMAGNVSAEEGNALLNSVRATEGVFGEQATLLHRAILEREYAFVEFLLEKGADLSVPIQGGAYDGKTALQLLKEKRKLELIPKDKRELSEEAEVRAKQVYTFFSRINTEIGSRVDAYLNIFARRP